MYSVKELADIYDLLNQNRPLSFRTLIRMIVNAPSKTGNAIGMGERLGLINGEICRLSESSTYHIGSMTIYDNVLCGILYEGIFYGYAKNSNAYIADMDTVSTNEISQIPSHLRYFKQTIVQSNARDMTLEQLLYVCTRLNCTIRTQFLANNTVSTPYSTTIKFMDRDIVLPMRFNYYINSQLINKEIIEIPMNIARGLFVSEVMSGQLCWDIGASRIRDIIRVLNYLGVRMY